MSRSGFSLARRRPAVFGFGLLGVLFSSAALAQTMTNVHVSSAGVLANGNAVYSAPSVSDDDRYVAFASDAANLVAGDTNGDTDAFVHDTVTGATVMVSRAAGGGPAGGVSVRPSLSASGRYAVFLSTASDLVKYRPHSGRLHEGPPRGPSRKTQRRCSRSAVPASASLGPPGVPSDGGDALPLP